MNLIGFLIALLVLAVAIYAVSLVLTLIETKLGMPQPVKQLVWLIVGVWRSP